MAPIVAIGCGYVCGTEFVDVASSRGEAGPGLEG